MKLKDIILNSIKNMFKILRILISRLSFVNKSLTIAVFPFSTAKYNTVS